jgi:GxxExxY protein
LVKLGLKVQRQVPVPVVYDGVKLDCGYRMDLLVEQAVIVELKAISAFEPIHDAQLLSHLKLSDKRVGLLINFHVMWLRDGIRRIVNNL